MKFQRRNLLIQLKPFKSGKTPGLDGIPVEVYQTFFIYTQRTVILAMLLLLCFNHFYVNGRLSDTQQDGLISLLLKQNTSGITKDPVHKHIGGPLTLQCCDANILAKCFVHRIKKVLLYIIHPNQRVFFRWTIHRR